MRMGSDPQNILRYSNSRLKAEPFSLLLIGSSSFCRILYDTIVDQLSSIKFSAHVSTAENIEQILTSSEHKHVDFIVFLMDTKERNCIELVERNICLVEPIYLCDKIILINCCNHLADGKLGLSLDELSNICLKYRLQMIHGNIEDEQSRNHIAKGIIEFSSKICGLTTGTPMVFEFPSTLF